MTNNDRLQQIIANVQLLSDLTKGMIDAEMYPVSFFSQGFDLIQKIQSDFHTLEADQVKMFAEQLKKDQALILSIHQQMRIFSTQTQVLIPPEIEQVLTESDQKPIPAQTMDVSTIATAEQSERHPEQSIQPHDESPQAPIEQMLKETTQPPDPIVKSVEKTTQPPEPAVQSPELIPEPTVQPPEPSMARPVRPLQTEPPASRPSRPVQQEPTVTRPAVRPIPSESPVARPVRPLQTDPPASRPSRPVQQEPTTARPVPPEPPMARPAVRPIPPEPPAVRPVRPLQTESPVSRPSRPLQQEPSVVTRPSRPIPPDAPPPYPASPVSAPPPSPPPPPPASSGVPSFLASVGVGASRNEVLSDDIQQPTINDAIEKKKLSDLRKAFSLNDHFRYRKELFGGSEEAMNKVITILNNRRTLGECLQFLEQKLHWDFKDPTVKEFIKILEIRFL